MISTRIAPRGPVATGLATSQVLKSLNTSPLRPAFAAIHHVHLAPVSQRHFSSSDSPKQIQKFFEEKETKMVRRTPATWPHPEFSKNQMDTVTIAHREAETRSDKAALAAVKMLRWGLDVATGYKHKQGAMTEDKYMIRNVFLESVAGVPGMVAGMLRHLNSMRRMKRDNGWIETLLEESYNERMHLLTFLKMSKPGPFMRLMVLGAQGVWCNALFFAYLISPRTVHRFVGYLEEEAVFTYTRQLEDLDAGRLPKWEKLQAPDIAVDYWNMPEGHRSMRDLLLYIRADESKHREVNHTLGNLNQKEDPNPYASEYKDLSKPHPSKDLAHQKPTGWERHEII